MKQVPIKIGVSLSLSGALASNGKTAQLAHKLWEEDTNRNGGLLGRPVEIITLDDHTDANLVIENYERLINTEKVDLVVGGYGNNSIAPAMSLIMQHGKYFVGLMGLGVNQQFNYENYFVMIPTGPNPNVALTEGFFNIAAAQQPKPLTVAILVADAPFSKNPVLGAKENAARFGLNIVYENSYPSSTQDFSLYMDELKKADADILFLCSYLSDSIGLVHAINDSGLSPKMVGGAMIGPQSGVVKAALGPLLNGLINYEYWLPVPTMVFSGVNDMISRYQDRASGTGADPLGHYVAPQAYAQMQVVAQSIINTNSLDDQKLADYTRKSVFSTVVGEVKFGIHGEWSAPRVLQVQFQNITANSVEEFKDPSKQVVVSPRALSSGAIIYPYNNAKIK